MRVCFSHDTKHVQYILKWFRFIIAKIYNILRYVIPHIYYVIRVICISKKLKYLKNEARESKPER